jgi:hypothetical protein
VNEQCVGRIISIDYDEIVVEAVRNIGDYVCAEDGVRFVGEMGSYLSINDIGRQIVVEIVSIDEKDRTTNTNLSRAESDRYLKLFPMGEIVNGRFSFGITKMPPMFSEVNLISEKDLQIIMDVFQSEESVGGGTRLTALPIGKSVIFPEYDVKVKLNEFFGFHFAVFGNTGSGKSNTIAQMIQTIFSKRELSAYGAKFVIFDSNGEYKEAFKDISGTNPDISVKHMTTDGESQDEKLKMPVWALTVDDWAVLLHASEKTQIPVISRALDLIHIFNTVGEDSNKLKDHIVASAVRDILSNAESPSTKCEKITAILVRYRTNNFFLEKELTFEESIDKWGANRGITPKKLTIADMLNVHFGGMTAPGNLLNYCSGYIINGLNLSSNRGRETTPYSLEDFKDAIDFAILYEGSTSTNKIYEYTATLVTRISHLMESTHGSFLDKTSFASVEEYIDNILGNNQLLNIDISNLDDTATEVVTKVFAKLLFDHVRKLPLRNSMPINFILEEAHRFVKIDDDYGVMGYNIFERIAREGRKYGLHMGISSQRPSELSKTVVSQCSNFIIHRMQNPDDLTYISRMVPHINKNVIGRITYLPRGKALVFGTAIQLPMLTSFKQASPSPNSSNSNIVEKWYQKFS